MSRQLNIVVVTGMSGAGRSTAIRALEDLDFFCIDNVPNSLIGQVIDACLEEDLTSLALGVRVRGRGLDEGLTTIVDTLKARPVSYSLFFLDASDDILLRRFSTTRRPHPLEHDGSEGRQALDVIHAIHWERELLAPLREQAHQVIDTTNTSVHELRSRMIQIFGKERAGRLELRVRLLSFGFKYGAPIDADVMFDVRFIDNPFFVEALRSKSGVDPEVRTYVLDRAEARGFVERVTGLLTYTLPLHKREGKRYLTVGIGCTGGRHRSVAVAERLAQLIREGSGFDVDVVHRDIEKEA